MHDRLFGYVLMQTQIYKVLGGNSSAEVLCIDIALVSIIVPILSFSACGFYYYWFILKCFMMERSKL